MEGYKPPRPVGNSPEARFMQWVYDRLTKLRFISTPTVEFETLTNGIKATVKPAKGGTTDEEVEVTLCDKYTGEQVVYLLRGRLKP